MYAEQILPHDRTILSAFENRKREAQADLETLSGSPGWAVLGRLKERYHVSQAELAAGAAVSADRMEIHPNVWAGIGLVRGGVGTALVGSYREVADRMRDAVEEKTGITGVRETMGLAPGQAP